MGKRVWIIRHGLRLDTVDPTWVLKAENRFDPPLAPQGHIQAGALAQRLSDQGIVSLYSSPFLRAMETAVSLSKALDCRIQVEPDLCEWYNPDYFYRQPQHLGLESLSKHFPNLEKHYKGGTGPVFPETWAQSMSRYSRCVQRIIEKSQGDIALITHEPGLCGLAWGLLDDEPSIRGDVASLVMLQEEEGQWHLVLSGDSSHLEDPRLGADDR